MKQTQTSQKGKPFPLVPVLAGLFALAIIAAVGGLAFAANQESHDAFCASCHTQPESTFFQRSTAGQAVDLASFHTAQSTGCIDCHSGQGVLGRVQAEMMGARNAARWYTGTAVQPAVLTFSISDQNCLKCHQDVVQRGFSPKEQISIAVGRGGDGEEGDRQNHWHQFMSRWQAASATAGNCVSCHSGHATGSSAQSGFMNDQNVQATCEACHQVLRREGGG